MKESEVRKCDLTSTPFLILSLKLCSPVLFCAGLALFCMASPLFRIQDELTLRMCQIFAEQDAETIHHKEV